MAVPAPAKVARMLAASAAVLVLLWCVHFRGGLSLGSPTNKGLIFNVRPFSLPFLPVEIGRLQVASDPIAVEVPGSLVWLESDCREPIPSRRTGICCGHTLLVQPPPRVSAGFNATWRFMAKSLLFL
jgi:hypothetical protein